LQLGDLPTALAAGSGAPACETDLNTIMIDPLTGLPTYRDIPGQLAQAGHLAVLVDVDALVWLNDQFGHEAGDRALAQIARVLLTQAAEFDGAMVFRVGGDELLVILPDVKPEIVFDVAGKIVSDVHELEIPFRRLDDPTCTRVEVNAAVFRLDQKIKQSAFRERGLDWSFSKWLAQRIYDRKQELGRSGVVTDLGAVEWTW
jgi:diguanylate cyclase (GGDEF)-like protein